MSKIYSQDTNRRQKPGRHSRWPFIIVMGCLLITFLIILLPRNDRLPEAGSAGAAQQHSLRASLSNAGTVSPPRRHLERSVASQLTAAQIVAGKVKQFGRIRHEIVMAIARKKNKDVPPSVEAFFDALERGNWDEIKARFHEIALHANRYEYSTTHDPSLDPFWRPVTEAFGAAEQAHLWPAQQLLDYGNAVLGALQPSMVYVGGTDSGCFIPTMMNETGDGEPHVTLTQNALADGDYLDYLQFLYGDQMTVPTREEEQQTYNDYVADASKRALHDQQFPDEPKQLQPGENVTVDSSGHASVNGAVSVMAINERIFQQMMAANPDMSFGLEESYPLKSTYADATTMGPIMELCAPGGQSALTADAADQSLAYWQQTAQQVLSDPAASQQDWTKAYAKMVDAQGNLFAAHDLNDEAEQAYRLAMQINPAVADTVSGYVSLLETENRFSDALTVAQSAAQASPGNKQLQQLWQQAQNSSSHK